MARCHELLGRAPGNASVEKQSQALAGFQEKWLDPLMAEKSASEHQAGLDVLPLEPGVAFEESLDRIARREHAENVLHGEATPANDRLATEDFGIDGDSLQKSSLVHGGSILSSWLHGPQKGDLVSLDEVRRELELKGQGVLTR